MTSRALTLLAGAGALTSAVTAVVYLNFSLRVMPRFSLHPDAVGLARMQSFNRTAVQPPFMLAFFGAALVGVVLVGRLVAGHRTAADLVAAGAGASYLVGFVITVARNVPLNDRLAALDAADPQALAFWRHYLAAWTSANSVRAGFSVLAAVLLLALVVAALARGEQ